MTVVVPAQAGIQWIPAPCFRRDKLRRNDERGAIYDVMYKIINFQSQSREVP